MQFGQRLGAGNNNAVAASIIVLVPVDRDLLTSIILYAYALPVGIHACVASSKVQLNSTR
jgi:hypothetical protein